MILTIMKFKGLKMIIMMKMTLIMIIFQVVILGDGGVGKSCLMNRFVTDRFDEHSFHTIGVEFLNKEIELGGETYTLQVRQATYILFWALILYTLHGGFQ